MQIDEGGRNIAKRRQGLQQRKSKGASLRWHHFRDQGDADILKFCGAGALSTNDRENYAVLMRIAMLSALEAVDSTRNLGFRCARDVALSTDPL